MSVRLSLFRIRPQKDKAACFGSVYVQNIRNVANFLFLEGVLTCKNKDNLSIGVKQLTNKEGDRQRKRKIEKYVTIIYFKKKKDKHTCE